MSLTVLVPKPDTPERRMARLEAPGRPVGRLGGSWNADITALRKCVILCDFCIHKFHPRRAGYEAWRETTNKAKCDDCGQFSPRCKAFIHESLHDAVGDWQRRPTKGRWAKHVTGWVPWWKR